MFAFLFHESMTPFYKNIGSMPTAFFTIMLVLSLIYWLSAILGMIDIDSVDIDSPDTSAGIFAGLMTKLGLNGIPFVISFSLIALFGWLISFYTVYFFFGIIPDGLLRWLVSIPVVFFAFFIAAFMASMLIKPFRPLFESLEENTVKNILGQTAIVRSKVINKHSGEVALNDGGAGLILKVRSRNNEEFQRDDRVVLLEYKENDNIYFVISEQEFLN